MKALFEGLRASALALCLVHATANAYHKVGNGDDGGDLEGLTPITEGPIVDAQKKAVELLEKLGAPGVRNLGLLVPEVGRTALYFSKEDKGYEERWDVGQTHADLRGMVYARTFAQPHAATRFFPVALALSQDQLVALQIHEGLHRSLPTSVRENESIVTQVTLAITSPGATRDQIEQTVERLVPRENPMVSRPADANSAHYRFATGDSLRRISNISYTYKAFMGSRGAAHSTPIHSMHTIQSDLYPFGGENTPFGMGIEGSVLALSGGKVQMGPLGISARLRVFQTNGFDIGLWGVGYINTLSNEEIKNSPFGRDIGTFGLSIRKRLKSFYVENFVGYTLPGSIQQQVANYTYLYEYGGVVNAKVRTGINVGNFDAGAFAELYLADSYRVSGGGFNFKRGRYRILSVGPEITARFDDLSVSLLGRVVVDSPPDGNLDMLGNVMGVGLAQGSIGGAVSYAF